MNTPIVPQSLNDDLARNREQRVAAYLAKYELLDAATQRLHMSVALRCLSEFLTATALARPQ